MTNANPGSVAFQLGQVVGELKGIYAKLEAVDSKVDNVAGQLTGVDDRLRSVERRSAINGSVTGGVVAVTVSLIAAKIRGIGGV